MSNEEVSNIIGDQIVCECCGLVRNSTSLVWQLAHEIANDFPACPTCVVEADEVTRPREATDFAPVREKLEEWSKTGEKQR